MKKLIIIGIIGAGIFLAWQKFNYSRGIDPLYAEPYVAVYGRNSCGWTQTMINCLRASNIKYHYFNVDDKTVADQLHKRMKQSGISTKRYNLPVVDVNGNIRIRPDISQVSIEYYEVL
jgi:glutaredoxin